MKEEYSMDDTSHLLEAASGFAPLFRFRNWSPSILISFLSPSSRTVLCFPELAFILVCRADSGLQHDAAAAKEFLDRFPLPAIISFLGSTYQGL